LSHLDDETIALAAIGEGLDEAERDHLATCDVCQGELDALARVVGIARSTGGTETLVAPPAAVWARIAADTGVDPDVLPTSLDARRAPAGPRDQRARDPAAPAVSLASARWQGFRTGFLIAAAIVGILLGICGTLAWQAVDDDSAVLATARLDPLPDKVGSGAAEVVDTADGRELELTLDTAAPPDAFLQVWLLSPDASLMVPVGVIAGDSGHWTLPPDVTLADYPVVDVSIEPYDGDPTHSSDSVVRGTLDPSSTTADALGD